MTYLFDSKIEIGKDFGNFTQDVVKNEPMFWSANYSYSYLNSGPITRAFLNALDEDFKKDPSFVFDSRVHMLMKGFWPAIPGIHHDDVPRTRSDGQPNYDDMEYQAEHAMGLVNGDIAPTEFQLGIAKFEKVLEGNIYKKWHDDVVELVKDGKLTQLSVESNKVIYFDWQTWHKATETKTPGWRWFGRASIKTTRPIKNEIRRQVQAYVPFESLGW